MSPDAEPINAVLITDRDDRILHVEGNAFAAHRVQMGDLTGRRIDEVIPGRAAEKLLPRYRAALAGSPQAFDYTTDDGARTYRVQIAPLRDPAGEITSAVAIMQDITDHQRVVSELARSEAWLHEAERLAGVGSWEMYDDRREIRFSPGVALLLGVATGDRLDFETFYEHVHPEDREIVRRAGNECRELGSSTFEYRALRPDGTDAILCCRAEAVRDANGEVDFIRGALLDVTEQRAAERERLAAVALFEQGFDGSPIGMALTDPADGACRRVNDALCRMLGRTREELIGVPLESFTHPDHWDAIRQGRRSVVEGGETVFQTEVRYVRPDGSTVWGLAHATAISDAQGSIDALHIQVVDITERRDREARLEHDVGDAIWLGRIREALDSDRLVLFAQPIVDLTTGMTVQHELLLRMRDEDGSIISPAAFLPVAERYGLISEIDRWVVREAVRIAASGEPIEFNLSARSVEDPGIVRELADSIEETGADPSLIVVEVTETALIGRTEQGRQFAEQVRALGCGLALDDFGTGFSSLAYLKHLPADCLKIDIEFIRELACSETDARVVRGIVALAQEFRQVTVAEGVEDEQTLMRLKELGVDHAQGYLFGRPAPLRPAAADPEPDAVSTIASNIDGVAVVRELFDAVARRDVTAMCERCTEDVVLRAFGTSQLAERTVPYVGHAGLRAYVEDVEALWDELRFIPMELRPAKESVLAFGRVEGRRGSELHLDSVVWIVRVRDGRVASIQVFQARRAADAGQSGEPVHGHSPALSS